MTDKIDNIGILIHYSDFPVILAICNKLNIFRFYCPESRKGIPRNTSGVYMFINNRIPEYIGESKNIARRVREHVRYAGSQVIYFFEENPGNRKRLETALIAAINPKGNSINTLFGRKR